MKQQKGASPSKARHQIQKIFIIHIELKSYVPIVLKYYKMKCFKMRCMNKLGLPNDFKIGLTWFRIY